MNMEESTTEVLETAISIPAMKEHWEGHRRLTRKTIVAFPEEQLFTFEIGGMRPFSELIVELLDIADGGSEGLATGNWPKHENEFKHSESPKTKDAILALWDAVTTKIEHFWPMITPERLQETDVAFGMYESPVYGTLLYFIDNEIHHRGQGYVYLRALGIEPPAFWDRA